MNYNRFLPLILPLATYLLFQALLLEPELIYVLLVLILLLNLFAARQFYLINKKEKWFNIIILPLFLSISTVSLAIIVPINYFLGKFILQFSFILIAVILYFYFRFLYFYLTDSLNYQNGSLENLSLYSNFLTIYFLSSAIFGLQSFLNMPIWILLILIIVCVALIAKEIMWINKIKKNASYFYIALLCLAIFELSWAVSFLTLSYYILGLLIAISFYVLMGIVRLHLINALNKEIIKTYSMLAFFSILIVLLTSRWI
jgi:hypothetical protein